MIECYILKANDAIKHQKKTKSFHMLEFRMLKTGDYAVNTSVAEIWPEIEWDKFQIKDLQDSDFPTNSST